MIRFTSPLIPDYLPERFELNVWAHNANGIVNSGVIQAWEELQATPSYFERYQRIAQREQATTNREFRGDPCNSCNNVICTCEE